MAYRIIVPGERGRQMMARVRSSQRGELSDGGRWSEEMGRWGDGFVGNRTCM